MNRRTVALSREQYVQLIGYLRKNYNSVISDALMCQACTGLRISDVLSLRLSDIVSDGGRYRLDITEKKTRKKRTFTVKPDVYNWLQSIAPDDGGYIFRISARRLQQVLHEAVQALQLSEAGAISTHSFRKFFASEIYAASGYDIYLVSQLLQHSSIAITQRYLSVSSAAIEQALSNHDALL